jgi:DNA-binding NtrC family response regulator
MVEIPLPKLADRKEDLPLLERHFLSKFSRQFGKQIRGITHRAQIALSMYSWPGNVRELENVIGHASMMTLSDTIDIADLPPHLHDASGGGAPFEPEDSDPSAAGASVGTLDEQEKLLILRAMQASGGNQSQAARILRIGRDALRYKIKKHGL